MSRFTEMLTLSLSMLGVLHITRYSAVKVLWGSSPLHHHPLKGNAGGRKTWSALTTEE
jgi:hypothetical protein